MSAQFWSGVGVAFQSALAAAIPLSAISKFNPGVCTYTGVTNPANGDVALFTVQGMRQLNGRVIRIANVNTGAKTFELEGEDTTSYDTFSATGSSFQIITFGITAATFTDVSASGGDPQFARTTTIHDRQESQVPTITSAAVISFESIWDPSDAAQIALKAAYNAISPRAVRLTFSSGAKSFFNGYISAPGIPTGSAQELVKTNVTVTANGAATNYST